MASGVNFGTQQYFGFDPRTIPSCALWLDAADSTTMTLSGSSVTQWRDKSGRGYHATGFGGTTLQSFTTGLNAITLNGSDTYFYASNATAMNTTSELSVFVAATMGSMGSADWRRLVSFGDPDYNSSNNCVAFNRFSNSNQIVFERAGWTAPTITLTPPAQFVGRIVCTGTNNQQFINGTLNSTLTASYGAFNYSLYNVGRYSGGGYNWTGQICEVVAYNSALTTAQCQQVEGYLAAKWGLTANLPTSHPYKAYPPTMRIVSPVDLPGAGLWLDAADLSTLTLSGTTVTQWRDKSGLGNNTTSIGGSPTYSSNSILLNGSSTYLVGPYVNTGTTITAFVVATVDFAAGISAWYYRLLSIGSTAANDYNNVAYAALILHQPHTSNIGGYRNVQQNYVTVTTNTPFVLAQQYTGSSADLYLNGTTTPSSTGSSGSFSTSSYSIGRDVGNTDGPAYTYWPGSIREVILYTASLTTAQRQQIEGYLAAKWGLQSSLPSTHPYRSILPSTPLLTPTAVSNCALWLDAADSSALTLSGSSVASWIDKSGNGRSASQSTGTRRPLYQTNQQNGLPAIQWDGVDDNLSGSFPYPSNGLVTFFVVYSVMVTTGDLRIWDIDGNYYGNFGSPQGGLNADAIVWLGGASYPSTAFYTQLAPTTGWRMYSVSFAGTSTLLWRNGVSLALNGSGANPTPTGTTYTLGNNAGGGNSGMFSGQMGEIVVYTGTLSTGQRQQVEGYLAWKWGLQSNLPSTHAFAKFRP